MDAELKLDTAGVLPGLREKYTQRLAIAEQKRDNLFRNLFIIDAALAFLITGQNFKLPILDVATTDIPAAVEAATLASSITIVFVATTFITWAAYDAIVRQFGNTVARPLALDPDFINAAESHVELCLKLLRSKFNIAGSDFHEPGKGFKAYSAVVYGLISLLFILFPIVHGLLNFLSLSATYTTHGLGIVTCIYFAIVITANLLAVFIWVGAYKDFTFYLELTDKQKSNEQSS
jgi:hypothetical protein